MSTIFKDFITKVSTIDDGKIVALDHYLDNMDTPKAPVENEALVINGWDDLHSRLLSFTEEDLRAIINYEVATYRRKTILQRLHMRYCKLRDSRERIMLLAGEVML
jgi:hypothetical protein